MTEKLSAHLFSIVIPTYNSGKTILQTLNSVTLLNNTSAIDLIISDDASSDDTIVIIQQWIKTNRHCFHDVVLIMNKTNGGISRNHQLAFEQVTSKYAVYIGADDIFTNMTCVSDLMKILENRNIAIAKMRLVALYQPSGKSDDMYTKLQPFFKLNRRRQFTALSVYGNFLYAGPGTILNVEILHQIHGFDARFRTFEDYPLFLNYLIHGYKIEYLDIPGIAWVRSEHSLSANGFSKMKNQFEEDILLIKEAFVKPNYSLLTVTGRLLMKLKNTNLILKITRKLTRKVYGFPI